MDLKARLQTAKYPITISVVLLGFTLVYWLLGLPTSDELAKIVANLLEQYGYTIVFAAALVETIPFFDVYFPGSTIVVLAVTLSQQGRLNVFVVLAIAGLTFIFGYLCDYALGRYGVHRMFVKYGFGPSLENTRIKLEKHGTAWLWIAYVHPILGSVAALSAGTLKIKFGRFLLHSLGATIFWVSFWGLVVYFGKQWIIHFILDLRWAVVAILVWLLFKLLKPPKRN